MNLARFRRLKISGSWYQRPALHRLTWYSNAGGVTKEIDHILVRSRWSILQNRRVYRSTEFFATDYRPVAASLKLHVKSRKPPRCNHTVFHLEKLKDGFGALDTLEDPEELWDTFKRETLEAVKECIGGAPEVTEWLHLGGDTGNY